MSCSQEIHVQFRILAIYLRSLPEANGRANRAIKMATSPMIASFDQLSSFEKVSSLPLGFVGMGRALAEIASTVVKVTRTVNGFTKPETV